MSAPATAGTSCAAFRNLPPAALMPGVVHRFVVGEDTAVRVPSAQEAAAAARGPVRHPAPAPGDLPDDGR
jgi:hypothetical protein